MRRFAPLTLLVLAAACSSARELEPSTRGECTACHGGVDNDTGAPPRDVRGASDPGLVSVGAHTAHVGRAGLACSECHPDARSGRHPDGHVVVAFGPLARRNGANPVYASGTCSGVYCHGQFQGGNGGTPVSWTGGAAAAACGTCHGSTSATPPSLPASHPGLAAGATQATCHLCHPDSVDASGALVPTRHADGTLDVLATALHPAGWAARDGHGLAAAGDVRACLACHAAKGAPVVTTLVCASCHDALAGGADWTVTCNTCHGSASSAAPPRDTSGNTATTARGVGAHQAHLAGGPLAPAFGCQFCHAVPADVLAEGHLDGAVTVTGYTGSDPVWRAALGAQGLGGAGPSCTTSYCHGSFRSGNAGNAPVWTLVGQGQAGCGSCHGLPPAAPHPAVVGLTTCAGCHSQTMTPAGALLSPAAGGKHLDGIVEAAGHDAEWMNQASAGFHAYSANAGLAPCAACHGEDLSGGAAQVACAQCHGASWRTTCTMCHGGTADTSGAPPRATWGHDAPADRTNVRIGAHTVHVTGTSSSPAFPCQSCHPARASALDAGHLAGQTAAVIFSGVAASGTWERSAATCAGTYCHDGGRFRNLEVPTWTTDGLSAGCNSCHLSPPQDQGHNFHGFRNVPCVACHRATTVTATDPALHVNGHKDVILQAGTVVTTGWTLDCTGCHG